jgi:hypothetical protein
MARNVPLHIPPERAEQLRLISIALGGFTISETLGHLIRGEVAKGTIAATVPGYDIKREGERVSIRTAAWEKELTTKDALRLVAAVRGILTPGNAFLPVAGLSVRRLGHGIKLRDSDNGAEQIIAVSLGDELATAIEAVAA